MAKKFKVAFSLVLSAIIILSSVTIGGMFASANAEKAISSMTVGDTFEFGSYPQTEIKNDAYKAKLESACNSDISAWVDYGYYSGSGFSDGRMAPVKNMMLYKDFYYSGYKYRAVKINSYRPKRTGGLPSSDQYSYQDDNKYYINNTYYFKFETIEWRVLNPNDGYVMCNSIIDSQAFQNLVYYSDGEYYNSTEKSFTASNWVTCTLSKWLNNDFLNTAFTDGEKTKINDTSLDSTETAYKIFLLSYDDVINKNYNFKTSVSEYDTARKLQGSDYAKCQGLWVSTSGYDKGYSNWYLRTAQSSGINYSVGSHGEVYSNEAGVNVHSTEFGIVPVFKFTSGSTVSKSTGETSTPIYLGDKVSNDGGITFKVYDVSVTFDRMGGNWAKDYDEPTKCLSDGSNLPAAENISKVGYIFDGWELINSSNTQKDYKAKWTICTHEGNTNKATCEESAVCSKCGEKYLPALGHELKTEIKAATFFKDGSKTTKCVRCNKVINTEELPSTIHRILAWFKNIFSFA